MEWEKYSKKYFNIDTYDDTKSGIRVEIHEGGSIHIEEEEFSLRVKTRSERDNPKNRNYAIEHHDGPPHNFPHIQFKFVTEEIGKIRIRIDLKNPEEYNRAVLGFIYKIKEVIEELEDHKKGITNEVMVLELVNGLKDESKFLTEKLIQGVNKYSLDFEDKKLYPEGIKKLEANPLLIDFLGKPVVSSIKKEYKKFEDKHS